MVRKKKNSKPRRPRRSSKPVDPAKLARRRAFAKVGLGILAVGVLIAGLVLLANYVFRDIPAVTRVTLAEEPFWLEESAAEQVRQTVLDLAKKNPSDPDLPAKAAKSLSQNIWVKRIVRIVNNYDGSLTVRCEFRKPLAIVTGPTVLVRVDQDGMVLPGRYLRTAPEASRYKRILGVVTNAPAEGIKWGAPDLLAGIALLKLIEDKPFSKEITAVDVSNYRGRRNTAKPHLVMTTEKQTFLYWGRAVGSEGQIEVDHLTKLKNLEALFRKFGSLNKLDHANLTGKKVSYKLRGNVRLESQ